MIKEYIGDKIVAVFDKGNIYLSIGEEISIFLSEETIHKLMEFYIDHAK